MKKLTYANVFSRYTASTSDKLAHLSYSLYKKVRLLLVNKFPLSELEKFSFEDHPLKNDSSTEMPCGYNYLSKSPEEGYINLEYIDFVDYLPKEYLDDFKKCIKKFIQNNKSTKFESYYTSKDSDHIDSFGRYIDTYAFSPLNVVVFKHNPFLQQYTSQVAISLCNLSSSFLIVRYRFYLNKYFQETYNEICRKKYPPYTDISRSINTPWYKPKQFGESYYTGDNAREKEQYIFLSDFKWKAIKELNRYFTIYFMKSHLFPPTFETYSTNIRPNTSIKNRKFWNRYMLDECADYASKYNLCVGWSNNYSEYEGLRMMAYCGGKYSYTDNLPIIAKHDIIHTYEIYLASTSIGIIAEKDIALCNKKISKAIKSRKSSAILKTRVTVEQKLYYSYRFISEFTGDTINFSEVYNFKNRYNKKTSSIEFCLKEAPKHANETKQQIDVILKNMNNAAEFVNTKSNYKLQWFMMIVTILSLIVATVSSLKPDFHVLKSIWSYFLNFIQNIDIL